MIGTSKRMIALLLILALCLPLAPLALAEESPAPEATQTPEATAAPETAEAPAGFEFLKAAKSSVNQYYVALAIAGFPHTLYAFTDTQGKTQFRVYGRLNKKKGMYEATVQGADPQQLSIAVTGEVPVKDKWAVFGKAKVVKLNVATLPEGYKKSSKDGVCYFVNLFKQKEYRVLGSLADIENAFYPAVYAKPKPGSLAIDISGDAQRFHVTGEKYYAVPRALRGGFAISVFITTTDGSRLSVLTDKPVLDKTTLK